MAAGGRPYVSHSLFQKIRGRVCGASPCSTNSTRRYGAVSPVYSPTTLASYGALSSLNPFPGTAICPWAKPISPFGVTSMT